MPITVVDSSATINTAYSLAQSGGTPTPQTDACILQVWMNLAAMQAGDTYVCKLYEKVISTGAQVQVEEWTFTGFMTKPGWVMPTVIVKHGWDVTLTRTAGTNRLIEWSLRKVS